MSDISNPFVGVFFIVTRWSLFRVTIPDLNTVPSIMKISFRGKSPSIVPVGGTVKKRSFWAISREGVIACKYPVGSQVCVPPPKVEDLSRSRRGRKTSSPVGLFLSERSADACLELCVRENNKDNPLPAFFEEFDTDTVATLRAIGLNHPYFSLSTGAKGKRNYAIPPRIMQYVS